MTGELPICRAARGRLSSTEINGGAYFFSATFEGPFQFLNVATSRASFQNARFNGEAQFYRFRCADDALFIGTVFTQPVIFAGASFQNVQFPGALFMRTIDLRGCTYAWLEPIAYWPNLMDRLDPYDRQPYTHLEDVLKRAGQDQIARDVYYARKRRESRRITLRRPLSWLLDRMLWLLTGYGVRLERLFIATAVIVLLGTFMFQREGAVISLESPAAVGGASVPQPLTLHRREAFWYSVKLFLPVEIPAAGNWRPSPSVEVCWLRMTTVATLLRLAG